MNKKGFTLIEVIVSIVLVSIILVSMMATLLKLRDAYSVIHENSDVIVYSSSIARVINNDLNNNNGIRYASCGNNGRECDLVLGNDDKRKLEIIKEETYIGTESDIEHTKIRTTLKYTNTSSSEEELLYIRTLELDKYQNKTTRVITTNGYIFYDMYANQYDYDSDSGKVQADVITRLDIRLYDGYNIDDERYNIILYASGRYDYSSIVGKTYAITLDSNDADIDGTQGLDEVFGVAFFESETAHTKANMITEIRKPKKGLLAFAGYYLVNSNDTLGEVVIDATGSIAVTSRKFKGEALLRAKWEECVGGYEIRDNECVPKHFNATLDQNGGSRGTSKYQATYMAKVPDIVISKRTGYTFHGYYDIDAGGNLGTKQYHDNQGLGKVIYDTVGDITLKAKWTPNHYNISYTMNDGTNNAGNPTRATYDEEIIIDNPSKVGYTFKGWTGKTNLDTRTAMYGTSSADTQWSDNNTKVLNKTRYKNLTPVDERTVNLEAHFNPNEYIVTYNSKGGSACSPSTKTVTYDSAYGSLCTPTRTGYTFKGWYKEEAYTNKVESSTIVKTASNHTLYAKWVDDIKPTCSAVVTTTSWSTSGVSTSVSCSDAGSGCKSGNPTGDTGLKSNKTYTVHDNAGNSNTCSVTVSSKKQKRTRTWNNCKTGHNTCKGGYPQVCVSYACREMEDASGSTYLRTWSSDHDETSGCCIQCRCSKTGNGTYDPCFTGENTCKGGWNDWGSWSDVSSCSTSDTVECRTLYK